MDATGLQLDLRLGAKKSLADPPKQCLALKSCDISSTRPHLLLVGGRYLKVTSVVFLLYGVSTNHYA